MSVPGDRRLGIPAPRPAPDAECPHLCHCPTCRAKELADRRADRDRQRITTNLGQESS